MRYYFIYAFSMFLSLGFALIYHVVATHVLTPAEYANLSVWLAPIVATAILAMGYQQYVAREIAKGKPAKFYWVLFCFVPIFLLLSFFNKNFLAYVFLPFIFLLSYYRGLMQNWRKPELSFNLIFEAGLRVMLLIFLISLGVLGALLSFTLPFLLASLPSLGRLKVNISSFDPSFLYFSLSMFLLHFPTNFSIMLASLVLSATSVAKLAAFLNLSKAILLISGTSLMEFLVEEAKRKGSKLLPLSIILLVTLPFVVFPQITGIFGSFYVSSLEFRVLSISMSLASILFLYVNHLWSHGKEKEALLFILVYLGLHLVLLVSSRNLFQAALSYLLPALVATTAIVLKVEILERTCAT